MCRLKNHFWKYSTYGKSNPQPVTQTNNKNPIFFAHNSPSKHKLHKLIFPTPRSLVILSMSCEKSIAFYFQEPPQANLRLPDWQNHSMLKPWPWSCGDFDHARWRPWDSWDSSSWEVVLSKTIVGGDNSPNSQFSIHFLLQGGHPPVL